MLVLKINYTKHLDRAKKSVRYHAFRSRETPIDRKGVFSRDSDHAEVADFIKSLEHPLTRPRQTRNGEIHYAVLHRLIFSLSRKEFEASGLISWKPVIREALATFERNHSVRLEWVAAEHQSRTHPHVHVDIKSVYRDEKGKPHRLIITQEMRKELRTIVERIIHRERERVQEERQQEIAFRRGLEQWKQQVIYSLGRGMAQANRDEPDPLLQRRRKRPPEERKADERER